MPQKKKTGRYHPVIVHNNCFFIPFLLFLQLGGYHCNILGIIKFSCQVYEIIRYLFKKICFKQLFLVQQT